MSYTVSLFKDRGIDEKAADRFNHVYKGTEGKSDTEDDAASKEALTQRVTCR